MGEIKRGALSVEHPSQLGNAARELDGRQAVDNQYDAGQRYLPMADGTPPEAVPEGETLESDFDVEPLNTPAGLARMHLRDIGKEPIVGRASAPEPDDDEEEEVPLVGNFVNLDSSFAHFDGKMIQLSDIDLTRISGIVMRAYQRELTEELKRIKSAYTMPKVKRTKKLAVRRKRRTRKSNVREASEAAPGLSTTEASGEKG